MTEPVDINSGLTLARNSNGDFSRSVETAARDQRAAEMLARRFTYQQIGDELGISRQAAHQACKRAMRDVIKAGKESTEEAIELEAAKLDALESAYLEILQKQHLVVTASGKVAQENGQPLEDDGPAMTALMGLLKISESRRRLLGLDAPKRSEISGRDGGPIELTDVRASLETYLTALSGG